MKTLNRKILLYIFLVASASCNTIAPQPTKAISPTQTITFPDASLRTELPSTSILPNSAEKTPNEWEGVPLMPNATEGHGDSQSYGYVVNELVDNINTFYQEEMVKLGWSMSNGTGNEMQSSMTFNKDGNAIIVTVVLHSDGLTYVTLEKQVKTP